MEQTANVSAPFIAVPSEKQWTVELVPLAQAMHRAMTAIGSVGKNKQNTEQGRYWYRTWDDLVGACNAGFQEAGLVFSYKDTSVDVKETPRQNGAPRRTCMLWMTLWLVEIETGASMQWSVCGYADDYADKAPQKARTAALKDWLARVFLIPFDDQTDPESTVQPPERPSVLPEVEAARGRLRALQARLDDDQRKDVREYILEQGWPNNIGRMDLAMLTELEETIRIDVLVETGEQAGRSDIGEGVAYGVRDVDNGDSAGGGESDSPPDDQPEAE